MENLHVQFFTAGVIAIIGFLLKFQIIIFIAVIVFSYIINAIPSMFAFNNEAFTGEVKWLYLFLSCFIGFLILFTILGYMELLFGFESIIGIVLLDYPYIPLPDIMVYDNIVLVYMFGCLFFSEIIYMIFSSMIAPTYSEFTTMMDTPNILVDSDRSSAFTMIGITFLLIGVSGTLFVHTLNVFSEYVFYILALCCIALMILFLIRLRTAKIQTQIKPIYCGKINTVPLCFYNTPCMIIKDQKICFTDKKDHFL